MKEPSVHPTGRKRDWELTPRAFRGLLDWLDEGAHSEGRRYLEMRRRLAAYFDRKNCPAPDELADETLNRVARRLEEEGDILCEAPAKYCYIVARYVFMEHLRGERKADVLREDLRRRRPGGDTNPPAGDEGPGLREKMLTCLERCAGELDPPSRETIFRYYAGGERARIENRRALAAELGVTANALSVRACRIRDRLEECVRRCLGAG
jgi:DNA-directed RNA polymerase specialized sigma24 family protein